MELAALPMANIGECRASRASADATATRPSTARSAASSNSRSVRRALTTSAVPSGLDDFEAATIAIAASGLGRIRTLGFQAREIFGGDIAGDVLPGEARGVEFLDAGM